MLLHLLSELKEVGSGSIPNTWSGSQKEMLLELSYFCPYQDI